MSLKHAHNARNRPWEPTTMNMEEVVKAAEELVHNVMGKWDSSHDPFHVYRVRNLALSLAAEEGLSPESCEIVSTGRSRHLKDLRSTEWWSSVLRSVLGAFLEFSSCSDSLNVSSRWSLQLCSMISVSSSIDRFSDFTLFAFSPNINHTLNRTWFSYSCRADDHKYASRSAVTACLCEWCQPFSRGESWGLNFDGGSKTDSADEEMQRGSWNDQLLWLGFGRDKRVEPTAEEFLAQHRIEPIKKEAVMTIIQSMGK